MICHETHKELEKFSEWWAVHQRWRRQRWLQPLTTDITPVWDFPQLVPTAPDMAEDCKTLNHLNSSSGCFWCWLLIQSGLLVCSFLNILVHSGCRTVPLPTVIHDLSGMDGWMNAWIDGWMNGWMHGWMGGWATPGVCPARSECFGHGLLLTHGILQRVKFKQDKALTPSEGWVYIPSADSLTLSWYPTQNHSSSQ